MTGFIVFVLIVVCALLWRRADALELRLEQLEGLSEYRAEPTDREPVAAQRAEAPPAETLVRESPAPRPAPPPPAPAPAPVNQFHAPTPAAAEDPEPRWRTLGFEDIFGRYLPIWAGGITLAVAGFLVVKYSIDAGLLSPVVRVIFGFLFGTALIAGAELAQRKPRFTSDPRIPQALAGAGIATLYASVLVAANVYQLVEPTTAFVGLAIVTALATGLSLRFGAPSAVLGLVGGLAAPALVGASEPNVPLLATYLALTIGGLTALGRTRRWWWLGALAVTGGFGWGLLLILGGLSGAVAIASIGLLTLLLGIAFPLLIVGNRGGIFRLAAAVIGCAQMAAIVATGGFAPLEWSLFGLISAAIVTLSLRQPLLAGAPLTGLGIGILLTIAWPSPTPIMLALVLGGGALIYGGPALWQLWRSDRDRGDALQIAAIAFAIALVPLSHFWNELGWQSAALLALGGAAIAGTAAALGWKQPARHGDTRFALLAVTAIGLTLLAAIHALPEWMLAPAIAIAAVAALLLRRAAADQRIGHAAHAFAVAALAFLPREGESQLLHAAGFGVDPNQLFPSITRWAIPTAAALAFVRWSGTAKVSKAAQAVAVLLGYVALSQLLSGAWIALIPVAILAGLALTGGRERLALPALGTAAALSLAWALLPLRSWLLAGGASLAGMPLYVTALPGPLQVAIRIAAPMLALILLLWRKMLPGKVRKGGIAAAAVFATIVAHVAWKQLFGIADYDHFITAGMAERTLWEMLLLAAAALAWRLNARGLAAGIGAAGLLHFGWFTLLIHNPLWDDQALGPWLAPAYGTAFAAVWLSRHPLPDPVATRIRGGAQMVLILAFALTALSQIFHGSYLAEGDVTQAEDIARSLLAIALAIGFLQWGIRTSARDWRIASLALMLAAVGKVFLRDAAGLDGLLRIASFAALGFSLIGVGWLYSRYLPDSRLKPAED